MISHRPDRRVPAYLGRVLGEGGLPAGTCFQVTAGLVVTASHVLESLGAAEPGSVVRVDPLQGGDDRPARVRVIDELADLAVLELADALDASVVGLAATDWVALGTDVVVTGVAHVEDPGHEFVYLDAPGAWAGGTTRDKEVALGRLGSTDVVPGMSGAPVRRRVDDVVVGVVSARYNSADGWLAHSVWVARTEHLESLCAGLAPLVVETADAASALLGPAAGHVARAAGRLLVRMDDELTTFRSRPKHVFGRARNLAHLQDCWRRAQAGDGRLVVVSGEAGVGKSVLAAAFVNSVEVSADRVLFAKAVNQGMTQVFEPIVRRLALGCPDETLKRHAYDHGPWLSYFARELRERLPHHFDESGIVGQRWATGRLTAAVAAFLGEQARLEPILVVIDDIQWADDTSWLVLDQLLDPTQHVPILLVATYRLAESLSEQEGRVRAELLARGVLDELRLEGLADDDIARWMVEAEHLFAELGNDVVAALARATRGNPLYLGLLIEDLRQEALAGGRIASQNLVDRVTRLAKSPLERRFATHSECLPALELACISRSDDFSFAVLSEAADDSLRHTLLTQLEHARAAHLVEKIPGTSRWTFSHGITRQALLDRLSDEQRADRHLRFGTALERMAEQAGVAPRAVELAYHFSEAAVLGHHVDKAVSYESKAADDATSRLAYGEALDHRLRALDCLSYAEIVAPRRRAELVLRVADAYSYVADEATAQEHYLEARSIAAANGLADLLAEATLGAAGPPEERIDVGRVTSWLEEAQAAADGATLDSATQARLAGRLLFERVLAANHDPEANELPNIASILAEARASGSAIDSAWALLARLLGLWSEEQSAQARLSLAEELLAAASTCGELDLVAWAHGFRIIHLLELGERVRAEQAMPKLDMVAQELHHGYARWATGVIGSLFASLSGRFSEAIALADQAYQGRSNSFNSLVLKETQEVFALRELDGHVAKEPMLQFIISQLPTVSERARTWAIAPQFTCGLAVICVDLGRYDEARRLLAELAADDFQSVLRDVLWPMAAALLSEVCAAVEDSAAAALLYDILLSREGQCIVVGLATACLGSADRYLGILAGTVGEVDRAEAHFQAAITINHERLQSPPWTAHAQHDYAALLLRRGGSGDLEKARDLNSLALVTAGEHGMSRLAKLATALQAAINAAISSRQSIPPAIGKR